MSEPLAPVPAPAPAAPLDTLPFAVLIDEAWRATRQHARAILGPAALALLPGALGLQLVLAMMNLSIIGTRPGPRGLGAYCGTLALGALGALVFLLWFGIVLGAMVVTVIRVSTGGAPQFWPAMRFYLRWRVWGTDLLARICTMLGLLACVVPGIFLGLAWSARLQVMALEGRSGFDALRRSWEVMSHNRGRHWTVHPLLKVLLLLVLGAVLGYAVSLVIQLPAIAFNWVLMFRTLARGGALDPQAAARATLWLSIPTGVLAALAQLAVQLYMDFAITFLVLDQLRRKEGRDLQNALDELLPRHAPPPPLGSVS